MAFAEIDSHIVGMIGTYLRVNNQPLESAAIVGVYVSKNYRGKGISRKLMNQMLEEISKTGFIKKVKLWVAEIQNSARKLYEKSGFKYIGKDKKISSTMVKSTKSLLWKRFGIAVVNLYYLNIHC